MTARRTLSTTARVELFRVAGGVCHICGGKIAVGEGWDVEHVIPLAQGGEDEPANMRPAHRRCHAGKTATDAANTAKAKRRHARHIGAAAESRTPLPFGRRSPWKRRMNGSIVRREA